MTSHEYAKALRQVADWFDARPEFETGEEAPWMLFRIHDKQKFLTAVRATKPGKKVIEDTRIAPDIIFTPDPSALPKGTRLSIRATRDLVCRKIQGEKWACEALLSTEEESELEAV